MYSDLFSEYEIHGDYATFYVENTNIPGLYENRYGFKFCTEKYLKQYKIPYKTDATYFYGYKKRLSNLTVYDFIYYGMNYFETHDGGSSRVLLSHQDINPIQYKELYKKKGVFVAEYDHERLLCTLPEQILPPVSSNIQINYQEINLKDFQKKSKEVFGDNYCVTKQPLEFIVTSLVKEIISEWVRHGNINHIAECEIKKRIFAKIISSKY
ncbi:hypothetical protein [Bacillus wiedmannii]|uniref:hypothetical protein n=1 Tax=Bacillus wiedmannii TaxID=1890302 RepID=UPI000BEB95F6|nr:hypothetical protein [Bacillus wiedmannii]PDZ43712.1 hypothetical protein CON82_22500 [Bacillus wiedmannii]